MNKVKLMKLRLARRRSRGTTVFVVVLVMTMLTTMGVFAARTASLNQLAAGYDRQSEQVALLSQHGGTSMAMLLSDPHAYMQMAQGRSASGVALSAADTDRCVAERALAGAPAALRLRNCVPLSLNKIDSKLKVRQAAALVSPAVDLVAPPNAGAPNVDPGLNTAGSLGPYLLRPDVRVEVTDFTPIGQGAPGYDATRGPPPFHRVTVSVVSQIQPLDSFSGQGANVASVCGGAAVGARLTGRGVITFSTP